MRIAHVCIARSLPYLTRVLFVLCIIAALKAQNALEASVAAPGGQKKGKGKPGGGLPQAEAGKGQPHPRPPRAQG